MQENNDYWWTGERGQALLDRISQLEERLRELLDSKSLDEVPGIVSINETRSMLGGVSRATIYRWIQQGHLAAVKVGGRRMVLLRSIRTFLAGCGLV